MLRMTRSGASDISGMTKSRTSDMFIMPALSNCHWLQILHYKHVTGSSSCHSSNVIGSDMEPVTYLECKHLE